MSRLLGRFATLVPGRPRGPNEIAWGPMKLAAGAAVLALVVYEAVKYFVR